MSAHAPIIQRQQASPRDLVKQLTQDNDGQHVLPLMKLLKLSGAMQNYSGTQAMKAAYAQTEDFEQHFQEFVNRL